MEVLQSLGQGYTEGEALASGACVTVAFGKKSCHEVRGTLTLLFLLMIS